MDKKDQRINVTPVSSEDYFMVQTLSELTLSSHSQIVARALNEWLKNIHQNYLRINKNV